MGVDGPRLSHTCESEARGAGGVSLHVIENGETGFSEPRFFFRQVEDIFYQRRNEMLRCKTRALAKAVAMVLVTLLIKLIDMIDDRAGQRA
jgi:hypothetical protein